MANWLPVVTVGIALMGLMVAIWRDLRTDMRDLRTDMRADMRQIETRLSDVEKEQAEVKGLLQGLRETIVRQAVPERE
ncbi:MAG: hypothetical protein OXH50_09530 [Gemmatimonadetes bacterium]|nr:hypothetical protein [Gemmatimonadota bacterium]